MPKKDILTVEQAKEIVKQFIFKKVDDGNFEWDFDYLKGWVHQIARDFGYIHFQKNDYNPDILSFQDIIRCSEYIWFFTIIFYRLWTESNARCR
jgi:hypothetical protein